MAEVSDYSKKFSQEKINGFNELIRKMAGEESIYYLDVQTVLKNEKGYLVADVSFWAQAASARAAVKANARARSRNTFFIFIIALSFV